MGLSIRAYARHRGVSHVAVKKAIDTGRITPEADGTIEPNRADLEWAQNTIAVRKAPVTSNESKPLPNTVPVNAGPPAAGTSEVAEPVLPTMPAVPAMPSGGTSLLQARTINEVVKAQTNKVRLAQLKGDLVDRSQAIAHIFRLARTERDAWLNWPARVSAEMAARLEVDAHELHVLLEAAVRDQLIELGELRPRVD